MNGPTASNNFNDEQDALLETFGGRLGGMVVEFSECMTDDQRARVLEDLDASTDIAYRDAALKLANILITFSKGGR